METLARTANLVTLETLGLVLLNWFELKHREGTQTSCNQVLLLLCQEQPQGGAVAPGMTKRKRRNWKSSWGSWCLIRVSYCFQKTLHQSNQRENVWHCSGFQTIRLQETPGTKDPDPLDIRPLVEPGEPPYLDVWLKASSLVGVSLYLKLI